LSAAGADDRWAALARQLTDAPPSEAEPAAGAPAPIAAAIPDPASLPPGADLRALGWALKTLCYAAWHGEPPRAARAAQWLQALAAAAPPDHARLATELQGLAHWTSGIACLTRSQLAEALTAFDAAAAALRQADCADAAAQTQVPKIMALSLLGRRAEAAACADATQRELRALGNLPVAARVILNLGNLQLLRAAYADAARQFRAAAVLFARIGDRTHSVLADIGLAEALAAMGDFDEAQRIIARARMRADHPGLDLQQALVEESAALLALVRGRYQDALAGLETARRRYAALGMPQYLEVGEKQLADAYLELRLLPEAWRLLDDAVARFAELALPDEQAAALAQRGRAEALLGRGAAADASFAAAARLYAGLGHAVGAASVADRKSGV
jgi:tetratricopeptide (TPR) repeat protein